MLARYERRNKLNRAQAKMVVQYSNRIQHASDRRQNLHKKHLHVRIAEVNRHLPSTPSPVSSSLSSLDIVVLVGRATAEGYSSPSLEICPEDIQP